MQNGMNWLTKRIKSHKLKQSWTLYDITRSAVDNSIYVSNLTNMVISSIYKQSQRRDFLRPIGKIDHSSPSSKWLCMWLKAQILNFRGIQNNSQGGGFSVPSAPSTQGSDIYMKMISRAEIMLVIFHCKYWQHQNECLNKKDTKLPSEKAWPVFMLNSSNYIPFT